MGRPASAKARLLVLLCIAQVVSVGAASASKRRHRKSRVTPAVSHPIPTPVAPAVIGKRPSLPQDLPPTPPQVQYYQGMLTINAQNSTLGDVLNAVKAQTGTIMDLSGTAAAQRVVFNMGPARPREVLSALLQGISYDYIIVGAREDPERVQRVMLTHSRSGAASVPDATSRNPIVPQTVITSAPLRTTDEDEEDVGGIVQPTQALPVETPSPPAQPVPANQPGVPRTREQMLQELLKRRQGQPLPQPTTPPNDPD